MQDLGEFGNLPGLRRLSDRGFYAFVAAFSLVALAGLAYLLVIRQGHETAAVDLSFLPAVNAGLNGLATVLLVAGWRAIRSGRRRAHMYLMISAFGVSALFLVSYLAYHYVHGDTKYPGQGPLRAVYFFILITHIVLSAGLLPLSLTTFFFAFRGRFDRHRRLARFTLPVWLYVSVTGVLIYFFLRSAY
ncbi:MAG: DUF420 domain-containing protein [Deltaproteobacteria bacterium]|nr:MAG: DUF420 domain-containing protein [Deltaproteobacteria bacterium]